MRHILLPVAVFGVLACVALTGCDPAPGIPQDANGEVPAFLAVQIGDDAELAAVVAAEKARVNYRYRLDVLKEYFRRQGMMDEHIWASRELENLLDVRAPAWKNAPAIVPPSSESLEDADTRALVELAVASRTEYLRAVESLAAFYEAQAPTSYKAKRLRNMQQRFDSVRTYMYFIDAEIPGPDIKTTEKYAEADAMFDQAIGLHRSGKWPWPGRTKKQRRALVLLRDMVRKYPRSTKSPMAAYTMAEIYKDYLGENVLAVHWYERAWQWDPYITEPARFHAAAVHDIRLHNPGKAIELYRASLQHDPWRMGNADYAKKRIEELTAANP